MEALTIEVPAEDGHTVVGTYRPVTEPVATALFVHGILADRTEWGYYDLLTESLQSRRIATLAIDYRGHGASKLSKERLMLSGMMLDIDAAWRYLRSTHPGKDVKRLISGNSFGGGVSYLYGSLYGKADHIFLTMPVLSYVGDITRVNPDWRTDISDGYISYVNARIPALIAPEFYFFDTMIEHCTARGGYTILHGTADSDVPYSESENFQRRHPNGRVFGMEGMDHTWAAPHDLERNTEQSHINQRRAVERSIQLLEEIVGPCTR